MPRYLVRQEPPTTEELLGSPGAEPWCDGLLVEGQDRAAARRAQIRAMNAARQAAERTHALSTPRPGPPPAQWKPSR